MSVDPRTPCVIGVDQRTWHLEGTAWAPEPLVMQAEVLAAAAADSAASGDVLAALDGLDVVHCMSWDYDDPPGRLAERMGIHPARRGYSTMSGTVPQQLLAAAAERIIAGESEVEAVVGAEALDTKRRMRAAGEKPEWSHRPERRPGLPFDASFHAAEIAHELFAAWLSFALRDVARRAARGVDPVEHRRNLGELLAPFTAVAARNPGAWFPQVRTAEELVTPTPANRMVGYPYTKLMVAVMDVDMAAAVILASWGAADRLGVPPDRRVVIRGWCEAHDHWYIGEHPDLASSPAMAAAAGEALRVAGMGVDDIHRFDLYSCFASSVDFARDALGLAHDDPRGLTVTGGLPYHGGPASNYMGHSVATMVRELREAPGAAGLVSGVGMHMTKHCYAVYGGPPPGGPPARPEGTTVQEAVARDHPPRTLLESATGAATLATYSVVHGRDGTAERGVAVCDLPAGERTYAVTTDPELMAAWEAEEWVGRSVTLTTDGSVNTVA